MKKPINPNYCASIVQINKVIPIENADKIQIAIIQNNSVVVSKELQLKTVGIFFPLECQISEAFLSKHNLLRDKTKNIDQNEIGFFESNGRIRAVKLRGQRSEGFFIPLYCLHSDYSKLKGLSIDTDFDSLDDEWICRKYIVPVKPTRKDPQEKADNKIKNKSHQRLIEEQFNLHISTIQARKNFHLIKPDDVISLTDKWHGTSAVFSNLLINKELKWYEKLLQKLNINIESVEYGNIYSSRTIIKNKYVFKNNYEVNDIWSVANNEIKELLPKGASIYCEIVGYIPGMDRQIQKGYSYGCKQGTYRILVYRVTNTNSDGKVIEYSWNQIKDFCNIFGLEHVKEFYYGYAKDLYSDIPIDNNWNENVLKRLSTDFNLEKKCTHNPDMPAEGIVIRADDLYDCVPMKLKSFAFLQRETKMLDAGEEDIEEIQSE